MQRLIRIIADDQPACTSGQGSLLLLHSYRFTLMTLSAWFLPSAFRRKKERYREAKSFPRVTEIANNRKYFESTLSKESENSYLPYSSTKSSRATWGSSRGGICTVLNWFSNISI